MILRPLEVNIARVRRPGGERAGYSFNLTRPANVEAGMFEPHAHQPDVRDLPVTTPQPPTVTSRWPCSRAELHHEELAENWAHLQDGRPPRMIEPLYTVER